jgi:hypothetical protein
MILTPKAEALWKTIKGQVELRATDPETHHWQGHDDDETAALKELVRWGLMEAADPQGSQFRLSKHGREAVYEATLREPTTSPWHAARVGLGTMAGVVTLSLALAAWHFGGGGNLASDASVGHSEDGGCRLVSDPLVVDWESHHRVAVEAAMRKGIAVVRYDCSSLSLLDGCSADAAYSFTPVSMKDEVERLETKNDLQAKLAGPLVSQLDGEISRGLVLDVAKVTAGLKEAMFTEGGKAANMWHLNRSALRGGKDCDGATHFVQGAVVGAFALGLETKGQARSASSIFSGSGESDKVSHIRDGQHDECKQLPDDAKSPSPACDALIRLRLVAIDLVAVPD